MPDMVPEWICRYCGSPVDRSGTSTLTCLAAPDDRDEEYSCESCGACLCFGLCG